MKGTWLRKSIALAALGLLMALIPWQVIKAERATPTEMEQAATNWVSHRIAVNGNWAGVAKPQIKRVQEIVVDGTVVGRCYSFEPDGFVVVPTLKEVGVIKVFSEEGDLDVSARGGMAALIRDVLQAHVAEFIRRYGSLGVPQSSNPSQTLFDPSNLEQWRKYAVDAKTFAQSQAKASGSKSESVGPLLTSRWHQDQPFNWYCPPGTPVGCVATAAAQILKYWEWPDEGVGSSGYWWDGGSGPNEYLTAEYWDSYDWANMPDYCPYPSCSTEVQALALAELSYEVAVAFEMDFDSTGSGVYPSEIPSVCMPALVNHFLYKTGWDMEYRSGGHTATTWFNMIKAEINALRPMMYGILSHEIVCDGWLTDDASINYYHMNYGWDDTHNAWYLIDNLYQPDPEGTYLDEQLVRYIQPNHAVMFTTEDRLGFVPYDVNFVGSSEYPIDSCNWTFGDGGTGQSPTCMHTYTQRGVYNISMTVHSGPNNYSRTKEKYVLALADSIYGGSLLIKPDSVNVYTVYASNTIPLSELIVPIEMTGDFNIDMMNLQWTTNGCRSNGFDYKTVTNFDPGGQRLTIKMANQGAGVDMPAGTGPILKLSFTLASPPVFGDSTPVQFDGYGSRLPKFTGSLASYTPITPNGLLYYVGCCRGIRGNVNDSPDDAIDISDLVYLVTYMFGGGPVPPCWKEANVNGDIFEKVDIADLLYLVEYMFASGPAPAPCF